MEDFSQYFKQPKGTFGETNLIRFDTHENVQVERAKKAFEQYKDQFVLVEVDPGKIEDGWKVIDVRANMIIVANTVNEDDKIKVLTIAIPIHNFEELNPVI